MDLKQVQTQTFLLIFQCFLVCFLPFVFCDIFFSRWIPPFYEKQLSEILQNNLYGWEESFQMKDEMLL